VRKVLRYFALVLALIVIALISALTTMRLAIHVREVKVPEFRGKSPAEARRMAEENGLAIQVDSNYYSASVPEGKVLSQNPLAGTVVRRGWNVQIALSLGPQRVTIPQVVGESERAAAITIAERGLQLSSTDDVQLPGSTPGQVVAQDPPANATDVSAPKIGLLVAQPASPQAFVMPSFIGQPLGTVTNTLKDAGFSVGKVAMAPPESTPGSMPQQQTGGIPAQQSSNQPPNAPQSAASASPIATEPVSAASIIVAQDPSPGRKVLAGAEINFVVR
jgi:beta-lactam-binding protein with PASTA domain